MLKSTSEADRREFVRGITGSEKPKKTAIKFAVGFVAGNLISRRPTK